MNRIREYRLTLLLTLPLMGFKQDTLRTVRLGEVAVTATQPNSPGTSSVIGRDAIRHIQAADLSNLLQLLPGVLTQNPNLNAPYTMTIRSATQYDATNVIYGKTPNRNSRYTITRWLQGGSSMLR